MNYANIKMNQSVRTEVIRAVREHPDFKAYRKGIRKGTDKFRKHDWLGAAAYLGLGPQIEAIMTKHNEPAEAEDWTTPEPVQIDHVADMLAAASDASEDEHDEPDRPEYETPEAALADAVEALRDCEAAIDDARAMIAVKVSGLQIEVDRLNAEVAALRAAKPAEPVPVPQPGAVIGVAGERYPVIECEVLSLVASNTHEGRFMGFGETDDGDSVFLPTSVCRKFMLERGQPGDRVRVTARPNDRTDFYAMRYFGKV